jgi:uncharacterized secreted protein with C-terminal beta-propeller domain
MKKFIMFFLALFFSVVVIGCNSVTVNPTGDNVGSFSSYDQLEEYLGQFYEKQKDGSFLTSRMFSMEDSLTGTPEMATDGVNFDNSKERDFSKTNNQVEGVEEADTILTDGYYIYVASGDTFFMFDATTLEIVYSYELTDGYLSGLYVSNGKVVLIASYYIYEITTSPIEPGMEDDEDSDGDVVTSEGYSPSREDDSQTSVIEPGYYYYYSYEYGTKVIVLDVLDIENINVFREMTYDSAYLASSRMIDGVLYLVLNNYAIQYFYDEETMIPMYIDTTVSDELVKLPANRIYFMPNDGESFSYLILSSFDVNDDSPASVKAYLGSTYQIYMSQNNLYATVHRYSYDEIENTYTYATHIMRFAIENNELVYKAIGSVEGSPLNQFSMDEYDGVFRIATTNYEYSGGKTIITNTLFLLNATSDDEMNQISKLSGLGKPGERIYSVRFSQDIAYVVTFVNTDPLYKLDLSNPQEPVVLGELYEEGVSDYLHEITEDLMIGVGRHAVTSNGWTNFVGVKIALYDTSGDEVVNLDTYLVEGEYSYTRVIYDHKAFVYFTPQDADFTYVAIPVSIYYQNYYGYSQKLFVFKISHSGEMELLAELEHFNSESQYFDSIEKAVMIENYIYTLSYSQIQVFDMSNDFDFIDSVIFNETYYYYFMDKTEPAIW